MSDIALPAPQSTDTPTAPTTITCTVCGCESSLPELFSHRTTKPRCPGCTLQLQYLNASLAARGFGQLLLLTIIASIFPWLTDPPWAKAFTFLVFNGLSLFFWFTPLSLLHEFAHASATWLQGGTVWTIHYGIGKVKHLKRWGILTFLSSELLIGGYVYASYPTNAKLRIRYFLTILAGPLCHLICIILLLPYVFLPRLWSTYAWRETLLLVNLIVLLYNCYPQQVFAGYTKFASDGLQLWKHLRGEPTLTTLQGYHFFYQANAFIQHGAYEKALACCRNGLATNPANLLLRSTYATTLILSERFEEASVEYATILALPEMAKETGLNRAVYLNNAAWAELQLGQLERAETYIKQAFVLAPWLPYIRGTLGAWHIERGEFELGIEQVTNLADELVTLDELIWEKTIATNYAYAAIGYLRLGKTTTAAELLEAAKSWNEDDAIVRKVAMSLQQQPSI